MNRKKNMLKKIRGTMIAVLTVMLLCAILPMTALAAEAGDTAGFTVQAQIPDNQIDKTQTYFDLFMSPGQTQTLSVTIFNTGNEAITVDFSAVSASTNRNGVIDYRTPGIKDETLKHPFSEMSEVKTPVLHIEPQQSATAAATVTMPNDEYDGTVLGGFAFRKRPDENHTAGSGMTITNAYSYVLAVKLTETDAAVLPDFELVAATPDKVNNYAEVTHYVRNFEAAIAKNITITNQVYSHAKQNFIIDRTTENIDMAPNSVMRYGLSWPNGKALPGNYTSHVRIEQGGKVWEFEKDFEIGGELAKEINNGAIGANTVPFSAWTLLLCVMAIVIITLMSFIIILLLRRRKRDKDEE